MSGGSGAREGSNKTLPKADHGAAGASRGALTAPSTDVDFRTEIVMDIAIIGAGAIGSMLAGPLTEHGHRVTLIGRPEQVEAIQRLGLTVHRLGEATTVYRVATGTHLTHQPDLVLLTVKTQDVTEACRGLLPAARGVPVVTMQNGVRADELAAAVLGPEQIVGAVVMCAASYLRHAEVTVQFPGWFVVGALSGPATSRVREVAAVLGLVAPTYQTQHLARVRWSKLLTNLNNALCAATGLTPGEIGRIPIGRRLSACAMREGRAVAKAAGIKLDHSLYGISPRAMRQEPGVALVALLQGAMGTLVSTLPEDVAAAVLGVASRTRLGRLPIRFSMWQSIARGRPSEIEYLNGEVVSQGERMGIPTPVNARLVAAVHAVERTHRYLSIDALMPAPEPAPSTPTAGAS